MKRIISIVLIICSLKCISLYTQTTGMYSIANNHNRHSEVSASICGIQVSYDCHFSFDRITAEVEREEESEEEPDEKINNEPYKELDKETLKEQAVLAYKKFIDGRCSSVGGINIYSLAMPTGEPDRRYPTDYAIIDVNGDGIPELNIQTAREFNVYSFENGEITFLGLFMPSLYGYCILKNGAYMRYSDRFSTCSYSYFELDGKGNQINGLGFYWDENNGNYIPDKEDDFFFDGKACSMEEWYDRTRKYLYTDENGREQIRNQLEWMTYCEADPFEINDQMLYYERKNGYQLTLYDKEHNEILSEQYPESLWIDGVSEDVLEIGISVGNPANYTYYFNQETAEISDTFFNAILVGDKYIAYMEDDAVNKEERTLILSDIFKEGILHQEITRDFSKTADPMSAIISIEMIDSENIRLEYYKGETYTIESEIVEVVYNGTEENVAEEVENVSVDKEN